MKIKFTCWYLILALLFCSETIFGQTAGDYRSNPSTSGGGFFYGTWSTASNWETYDGSSWIAASSAPTSSDGIITILAGDSMILNAATTIDQVIVQNGARLSIFNTVGAFTVTLNDASGTDIDVSGGLYVSTNATVSGSGTVQINSNGFFVIRNTASFLSVATTNNGTATLTPPASVSGTTFINNGTMNLSSSNGSLTISGSTITNNGTANITGAGTLNILGPGGTFTNAAAGTLFKESTTGNTTLNTQINFNNAGILSGFGSFIRTVSGSTTTNTGIVSPGSSPGILILGTPFAVASSTSTYNIEISSTGAVAGTNFDQVQFPGAVNITGSTLNLTQDVLNSTDHSGTSYIILQATGAITGPFATVNKPSNFSITYNANDVTVTKTAFYPLPLTWGSFTAIAKNDQVVLKWTTLQETNTSYFIVEHSEDGRIFIPVANLPAKGNSSTVSEYSFTHTSPVLTRLNYYRLRQVDIDGKETFSEIRTVRFNNGKVVAVQVTPNPVRNILQLSVQLNDINIKVVDINGKILRNWQLEPGIHQMNVEDFPAGTYQLLISQKGGKIEEVQKIIKL